MEHRVSNTQIDELLDHLASNSELVKVVGVGSRSKEATDRKWNELAESLNSHGSGAQKSGQRWRRYWADIKHKAKTRAAARRQAASNTGTREDLSDVDQRVLEIIRDAAVYGEDDVPTVTRPVFVGVPRPIKRSPSQTSRIKTTNMLNHRKVDTTWVMEMETRRIAAEEKMAEAVMIMAEAARANAETARVNSECTRMHYDLMNKLIEILKK